jgi:hypothetical protein
MRLNSYLGLRFTTILNIFSGPTGLGRTSLLGLSAGGPFFLLSVFGSVGGWAVAEAMLMVPYP